MPRAAPSRYRRTVRTALARASWAWSRSAASISRRTSSSSSSRSDARATNVLTSTGPEGAAAAVLDAGGWPPPVEVEAAWAPICSISSSSSRGRRGGLRIAQQCLELGVRLLEERLVASLGLGAGALGLGELLGHRGGRQTTGGHRRGPGEDLGGGRLGPAEDRLVLHIGGDARRHRFAGGGDEQAVDRLQHRLVAVDQRLLGDVAPTARPRGAGPACRHAIDEHIASVHQVDAGIVEIGEGLAHHVQRLVGLGHRAAVGGVGLGRPVRRRARRRGPRPRAARAGAAWAASAARLAISPMRSARRASAAPARRSATPNPASTPRATSGATRIATSLVPTLMFLSIQRLPCRYPAADSPPSPLRHSSSRPRPGMVSRPPPRRRRRPAPFGGRAIAGYRPVPAML